MTETVHRCNRCREVIAIDRTLLRVESGPWRKRTPEIDLFVGCLAALQEWLAKGEGE